jgi:ssDNA-binding Zn-finger/Zn-ribbon topoisomerase 1
MAAAIEPTIVECPRCCRSVALRSNGRLIRHGARRCPASERFPEEVGAELTGRQPALFAVPEQRTAERDPVALGELRPWAVLACSTCQATWEPSLDDVARGNTGCPQCGGWTWIAQLAEPERAR